MTWARRLLLWPPTFLVGVAALLLSPVLLVLTGLCSLAVDRRCRLPRAVIVAAAYLCLDAAAVTWCGWERMSRLGGRDATAGRNAGQRVATWLLATLYRVVVRVLGLRVEMAGDRAALEALRSLERPLVVLSRHAGPGDSFLLAHLLLQQGRRLHAVMRAALQLDPGIDTLGHLLPCCFVRRGHAGGAAHVQSLAAEMDDTSALLLFPEGGNVNQERVRRNLRALVRAGMPRRARQAGRLRTLAAPFPNGVLAALRGAPAADVIFLVHGGLSGIAGPPWRWVPADRVLHVHAMHVRRADVPASDAARTQWLFDWWQRMDALVPVVQCGPSGNAVLGSIDGRVADGSSAR